MRTLFTLGSTLLLVLQASVATAGTPTIIETLTLKPGEAKSFSVDAESKTKIGFAPNLSFAERKNCKHQCIQLSQEGGISVASSLGSAVGIEPVAGKIDFTVTNVEDFPIEVEIYRK